MADKLMYFSNYDKHNHPPVDQSNTKVLNILFIYIDNFGYQCNLQSHVPSLPTLILKQNSLKPCKNYFI